MKMKLPRGFKTFAKSYAKMLKNRAKNEKHPTNYYFEGDGYSTLKVHEPEDGMAYLEIYAGIGWWITDEDVAIAMRNFEGDEMEVRINCGGGDVFMGLGIASILSNHKAKITARIEGICASIATVIALGCDEIEMVTGSQFMVHSASLMAYGNAEDFRVWADWLDKTTAGIMDIYEERTNIDRAEIELLVASETYLSADEAVEKGFADRVVKLKSAKAEDSPEDKGKKVPESVKNDESKIEAARAKAKRKRQAQALAVSGGRFQ